MTKSINRGPAHLLQKAFLFPKEEVATVARQMEGIEVALNMLLNSVPAREERVIRKFYGIQCSASTINEIAESLDVSRQRVLTIRDKAVRRLQQPARLYPVAVKLSEHGCDFTGLNELVRQQEHLGEVVRRRPIDPTKEQFGRDHAPSCTSTEPCPTCRLQSLLASAGLTEQFEGLLSEWLEQDKSCDIQLHELELSARTSNALRERGLLSLNMITSLSAAELLQTPGLGRKRFNEVLEVLSNHKRRLRV